MGMVCYQQGALSSSNIQFCVLVKVFQDKLKLYFFKFHKQLVSSDSHMVCGNLQPLMILFPVVMYAILQY